MMDQKKFKSYLLILIPPIIIIALIITNASVFILPTIKNKLIEQQKESLREMGHAFYELLHVYDNLIKEGQLSEEKAKLLAKTSLSKIKYGEQGENYFWILGEDDEIIAHPYYSNEEVNEIPEMQDVVRKMIALKNKQKEGYFEYLWPYTNNTEIKYDKIAYIIHFEPWNWVIGTGFYKADITRGIETKIKEILKFIGLTGIFLFVLLIVIVIWNLSQLKKLHRKDQDLTKNKLYIEALSEYTGDGLIITENNKLVLANKNFMDILELDDNDSINESLSDLIIDKDKKNIRKLLLNTLKGRNKFSERSFWITTKKGKKRYVTCRMVSNQNAGNTHTSLFILSDISEKQKSEARIGALLKIVMQSPTSIMITDINGNIEFVNPAFEKQTGYTSTEVLGKNPRILKSNNQPEQVYADLWKTIRKGGVWRREILNKKKNGDFFWELAAIFPLRNALGKIMNYAAVKIDITETKKIKEELIKAKNKAEENDRLKAAFLGNVSHEINTPLNAIFGFSNLAVQESKPDSKINNYLKYVSDNTEILIKIFNDIIRYSKIDSGILEVKSDTIQLNDFILKICSKYNYRIKRNNNQYLEVKFIPVRKYSNVTLKSDKELLSEVFGKLLENAIKYTQQGEIEITYTLESQHIKFFIKDTGKGIHDEEKDKIFHLFYHGETDFVSLHKGLGMGLSLAKHYIEKLGGEIHFESTPQQGTTFYFTLPVEKVSFVT